MVVQARIVFCQTYIATTAIGSPFFTEVRDQHPAPAYPVFVDVFHDPVDTAFKTFFTLFVSRTGNRQIFNLLPGTGIDNERCFLMRNVIDNPVFGKSDQHLINLLLTQSGTGRDQPFINIYVIRKQTGVGTEYHLYNLIRLFILMQVFVKLVTCGGKYQTRSIFLFFRIFYVACQFKYL